MVGNGSIPPSSWRLAGTVEGVNEVPFVDVMLVQESKQMWGWLAIVRP